MAKRKRELSHGEWIEVANTLKQADRLLWNVVKKLTLSLPVKDADKIIKISHRISAIKSHLETEAHYQHPEWGPPNHVFFGPLEDPTMEES